MRKNVVSTLVAAMLVLAIGVAIAAEDKDKSEEKRPPRPRRVQNDINGEMPRGIRAPRRQAARGEMLEQQLKKVDEKLKDAVKRHKEFIGELKSIKAQAEKENADKTADMLGKLITKREKAHAEAVGKIEKNKERLEERIKARQEQRKERQKNREQGRLKRGDGKLKGPEAPEKPEKE